MSIPSCFQSIIGFSRKSNECVDDVWDDSYAESASGLYLDELPGFPQNFVASMGGNYDLWEKYTNSLDNAINAFKVDVVSAILKNMEPVRQRFKGDIGGRSFTNTLTGCTYQGLRMYSNVIGGVYNLRGFYIILNVTGAVNINIYDEYDLLHVYTVDAVAGRPVYTAITPLELPLDRNYYFLYTTAGSCYDNKVSCNCGGYKWCFRPYDPCYRPSRERWTEWAMVGGVCGETLADRDDWAVSINARGLVLHGDFSCDIISSLCNEYSDFTGADEIDYAIAFAILYKTGEFLSIYVMDSEEVSRRTLLGTEQWNANKEFYAQKYQEMITFIANNWTEERNECLKCRDPYGFRLESQML